MKNLNKLSIITLVVFITTLLFSSCKEDDKNNPSQPSSSGYKGVFVLNEGGFMKGNASVDFYKSADSSFSESVFTKINNRPVGDILQSMTKFGDKFYLIVNNSQKIEVVNASDFKSAGTISNINSPRYLLPVSTNKAYVTDLFANEIHIINLTTMAKTGSIKLPGWNEQMLENGGQIIVNNWSMKKTYVIDPAQDKAVDSFDFTGAPNGLVKDNLGKIWVLVDSVGTNKAKLVRLSIPNHHVEATIEFPAGQSASKLAINGAGDKLYYINSNGLFELSTAATSLPSTPKKAGYFYGLGVDPVEGSIYITDPLDFNQKGVVYRIKPDGKETNFKAGIVPGGFYFNN